MEKTTTHVSFVCQKCTQPIKLNRSLQAKALVGVASDVEAKLVLELSGEEEHEPIEKPTPQVASAEPEGEQSLVADKVLYEMAESTDGDPAPNDSLPRSSQLPPNLRLRQNQRHRSSLETVSVIYNSLPSPTPPRQVNSKSTLKHIQIASETFKMVSLHTDVDHPLCVECPEAVLDSYDQEICHMEEAKKHYEGMAARMWKEVEGYKARVEELDTELEALKKRKRS